MNAETGLPSSLVLSDGDEDKKVYVAKHPDLKLLDSVSEMMLHHLLNDKKLRPYDKKEGHEVLGAIQGIGEKGEDFQNKSESEQNQLLTNMYHSQTLAEMNDKFMVTMDYKPPTPAMPSGPQFGFIPMGPGGPGMGGGMGMAPVPPQPYPPQGAIPYPPYPPQGAPAYPYPPIDPQTGQAYPLHPHPYGQNPQGQGYAQPHPYPSYPVPPQHGAAPYPPYPPIDPQTGQPYPPYPAPPQWPPAQPTIVEADIAQNKPENKTDQTDSTQTE
jgi:hypothetical protein